MPLGVFHRSFQPGHGHLSFSSISDPLDSTLPQRFSVPVRCECQEGGRTWEFQGCRHGCVLLFNRTDYGYDLREVLVWNPVAGEHHLLGIPHFWDPNWDRFPFIVSGAVICSFGDKGPFNVALAWKGSNSAHVCVYSSETGVWGDVISVAIQPESRFIVVGLTNVLVGNSLYWPLFGSQLGILEFDLGTQNLAVIEVPLPSDTYADHRGLYLTTLARGGGLSLIVMSANLRAQLWERTADSDGVTRWMQGRTIELDKLLSLRPRDFQYRSVLGLDGDNNVIFVSTCRGIFMVHLKLLKVEKIFETNPFSHDGTIYPFKNLNAPAPGSQVLA